MVENVGSSYTVNMTSPKCPGRLQAASLSGVGPWLVGLIVCYLCLEFSVQNQGDTDRYDATTLNKSTSV
jgi:hypothetical protein